MRKKLISGPKPTFGKLKEGDSIYYVSPINQDIEGYKIKEITGFSNEEIAKAPKLKFAVKVVVYHNLLAFQSPDIEKIPTLTFVFNGLAKAQICIVKVGLSETHQPKMPVPFFSNIDSAREWKTQ